MENLPNPQILSYHTRSTLGKSYKQAPSSTAEEYATIGLMYSRY